MKLYYYGFVAAAAFALLTQDVDAKKKRKRQRKVVVRVDKRAYTSEWAAFDGKWQKLGVCGVPLVSADESIVSGIPKEAHNFIKEIASDDAQIARKGKGSGGNRPGKDGSCGVVSSKTKDDKKDERKNLLEMALAWAEEYPNPANPANSFKKFFKNEYETDAIISFPRNSKAFFKLHGRTKECLLRQEIIVEDEFSVWRDYFEYILEHGAGATFKEAAQDKLCQAGKHKKKKKKNGGKKSEKKNEEDNGDTENNEVEDNEEESDAKKPLTKPNYGKKKESLFANLFKRRPGRGKRSTDNQDQKNWRELERAYQIQQTASALLTTKASDAEKVTVQSLKGETLKKMQSKYVKKHGKCPTDVRVANVLADDTLAEMESRVVGGRDAKPDTWPWQTHLTICGKWYGYIECNVCGASIISPAWLLTAAHCIPEDPSGFVVYGATDLSEQSNDRTKIMKWVIHPDWDVRNFNFDVSLLQPEKVMEPSNSVAPICLPHPNTCWSEHTACVVTGWGLTGETKTQFPDKLQEVAVRLIAQENCKRFNNYHILTDNMMCAGYSEGQRDACAGDSGGPLVCKIPSMNAWVLQGTVSWGYGCARPGAPGVYAKVNQQGILDFIKKTTGLEPDPNLQSNSNNFEPAIITDDNTCFASSKLDDDIFWKRDVTHIVDNWKKTTNNNMKMWQEKYADLWADLSKPLANVTEVNTPDTPPQEYCDIVNNEELTINFQNGKSKTVRSQKQRSSNGVYAITTITPEEIASVYNITMNEATSIIQQGALQNSHYPKPYQGVQKCRWLISNQVPDFLVSIAVSAKLDCQRKTHFILQNSDTNRKYRVCRTRRVTRLESQTGFELTFNTDIEAPRFGNLKIDWLFKNVKHVCDPSNQYMTFNDDKNYQQYKTENYPKLYSDHSQCRWEINYNKFPGKLAKFQIEFPRGIATERNIACGQFNDNMIFFESEDCSDAKLADAPIWTSFCGFTRRKKTFEFHTKTGLCVVFIADGDKRRSKGAEFNVRFGGLVDGDTTSESFNQPGSRPQNK